MASFNHGRGRPGRRAAWTTVAALAIGLPARAQTPVPSPIPEGIQQDQLDLQGRANVVQGSGARALGMGGAFLARADDATAASWNPAGLSYLRYPEVSLVGADNRFNSETRDRDSGALGERDRRRGRTFDFLAASYPLRLGPVSGAGQVSLQRVIPFGSRRTIERPGDPGALRRLEADGGFDVLAIGAGFRLSHKVRVGATLNRWFNGFDQTFDRPAGRRPARNEVEFDLSGWNAHAGVIVTPWEGLNLGAVAKNGFSADVRLKRKRTDLLTNTTTSLEREDVLLRLPGAVGVGASWRARNRLTISVDYTRTYWSGGRIRNYFVIFERGEGESPIEFVDLLPYPTLTDDNQKDTEQVRVGVEYVVLGGRVSWPLRAGYFNDRQYFRASRIQDELVEEEVVSSAVPAGAPRFNGLTLGTGLLLGPLLLDVAYVREFGAYLDLAGLKNTVTTHRLLLSVIYRHGGRP